MLYQATVVLFAAWCGKPRVTENRIPDLLNDSLLMPEKFSVPSLFLFLKFWKIDVRPMVFQISKFGTVRMRLRSSEESCSFYLPKTYIL